MAKSITMWLRFIVLASILTQSLTVEHMYDGLSLRGAGLQSKNPMQRIMFLRKRGVRDFDAYAWKIFGVEDESMVGVCSDELEAYQIVCTEVNPNTIFLLDAVEAPAITTIDLERLSPYTLVLEKMPKDRSSFRSKFSPRLVHDYRVNHVGVIAHGSMKEGARRFLAIKKTAECKDWKIRTGLTFMLFNINCRAQKGQPLGAHSLLQPYPTRPKLSV